MHGIVAIKSSLFNKLRTSYKARKRPSITMCRVSASYVCALIVPAVLSPEEEKDADFKSDIMSDCSDLSCEI